MRSLDLDENGLTDRAARALIKSPYLREIHSLYLNDNEISPALREALKERFGNAYRPRMESGPGRP